MELNPHQQQAVRTVQGRVLILAGAGSGKTGVIVHRIVHLIRHCGVDPGAILGLTFTNKAALEMRLRVESLLGKQQAKRVWLSTFHSFCMALLRQEIHRLGFTKDFSLYDERDLQRILNQLAREELGHEGELPSLAPTKASLAKASQEGMIRREDGEGVLGKDTFSQEMYFRLQKTLRAYNAVSFDSLITLTIQLFEEHPEVLKAYQEKYLYLMIDEYQDTNPAQFKLAELLASRYQNLCVVGDDDQSIYGWRGARIENILQFQADHTIRLEQNYRSGPAILQAANAVIASNKNRHAKKLWTVNPDPQLIEVFHAPTEAEEAQAVVDRLLFLKEREHLRWADIAILYRSNALSRSLEMALLQTSWQKEGKWIRGIPYAVFGGLEFSERGEIKDLLAYLRAIANPLDQEALLRIINVPRRGISDTFLDTLTQKSRSEQIPLWSLLQEISHQEPPSGSMRRAYRGVRLFVETLEKAADRFSKDSLAESLIWFLEEIAYKKAIEEEVKSERMRAFKWENIQECVNALAEYEKEEEEASLSHFIAHTLLGKRSIGLEKKEQENRVHLMTFHSAKGLEFPACFLIGLEEGILPHEKGMAQTGLEEERRLFYVGLTRARRFLTLSMARSRLRMGKTQATQPSRFLFEIPKSLLHLTHVRQVS